MKNEFVPYDIALAMKELGFDEPCFGFYNDMDNNTPMGGNYPCDGLNSAPLYQQAFRWFREKYNLYATIVPNDTIPRWMVIQIDNHKTGEIICGPMDLTNLRNFKTYEEAELACLRKLIEIVNQNKDE
jgi:hypothetical protein